MIKPLDVQVARHIDATTDKCITAEIDMMQKVMYFVVWADGQKVHSGYDLRDAIAAYNVA
jgi:hypothetical protein